MTFFNTRLTQWFWLAILSICVSACGQSGSSNQDPAQLPANDNSPPSADAGNDLNALEGDLVALSAAQSQDPDGDLLSYTWTQTSGPSVELSDNSLVDAQFIAPDVTSDTLLQFQVSVSDTNNANAQDLVNVSIQAGNRVFTELGFVEGESLTNSTVFRGIAYAAAPVEDLRWSPPQSLIPQTDIIDATEFGDICFQTPPTLGENQVEGLSMSEDCLYLNVWTPSLDNTANLPVMFWVHGGGNNTGASNLDFYDGQEFAENQGIILVSVNYRLGPMGYFAHPALNAESSESTSGNYGLLDIIAALQWVQTNIKHFGGNPEQVTIFGQSAGGVNTCAMIASPLASDLFHRAILQSSGGCSDTLAFIGTALDNNPTIGNALQQGLNATSALGCDSQNDPMLCLRALSAESIYEQLDLIGATFSQTPNLFANNGFLFEPIIDGTVLSVQPLSAVQTDTANNVPIMLGSTSNEAGSWRIPIRALLNSIDDYQFYIEYLFDDDLNTTIDERAQLVLNQFPATTVDEAWDQLERILSDVNFTCGARRTAKAFEQQNQLVWLYEFARVVFARRNLGAIHSAEIPFVFGPSDDVIASEADLVLSAQIQTYWANFAKFSDPNSDDLPAWAPYESATDQHMILDIEPELSFALRAANCDLFDELKSASTP